MVNLLGASNVFVSAYCFVAIVIRVKNIYMDAQDDVQRFVSCPLLILVKLSFPRPYAISGN